MSATCNTSFIVCNVVLFCEMVKSCAAFNCTSRFTKDSDNSFHKFPLNDDNLLKKWITAIKRKNFKPTNYSFLCSKHFTAADYHLILPNTKLKRLKNEAIPTVFDFPSHLQRPTKQRRILVRKELPNEHEDELQYKSGTSISSIAPPVEQALSQSPQNAPAQESCYFLAYKFSQDHLELFFSCVRSRGGNNDTPNTKQFTWAVRQLMFRNSVRASTNANCLEFDPSSHLGLLELGQDKCDLSIGDNSEIDSAMYVMESYDSSSYKDEILYYICGVIVRRIEKSLKCNECSALLHTSDSDLRSHTRFTSFKSKGKLIMSSDDAFKIVKYAYLLKITETKATTYDLTIRVCNNFTGTVFKGHLSNDEFTGSHELFLIKSVVQLFF